MPDMTWILVANSSRARLFERGARGGALKLLREFRHPESRERPEDLVSDQPGHVNIGFGRNPSVYEPPTSPKRNTQQRFALELARELERGAAQGRYEALIVSASSPFLGMLKKRLASQAKARLRRTLDKDYTTASARQLAGYLRGPAG
jgi:protein required for attachment to host cells